MRIEVRVFAALREALGTDRFEVDLPPGAGPAELRASVAALHPRWRDLIGACRVAVGVDFVPEGAALAEGSEVVLVPPVSGGGDEADGESPGPGPPPVELTLEPLDAGVLERAAESAAAGAVVVFVGTVRSPNQGRDVDHLEYEAYAAMARAQMERVAGEARERWPVTAVFLHHRLGRIEVGEASVVAVAAAPHRGQAFEACRHLIERLKADVPIWKKECFADGSEWVGAPGECAHDDGDA